MSVALSIGIVALAVLSVVNIMVLDRANRRLVAEMRHLTHLAVSRHAGEMRLLEPVADERPDRLFVNIEGLT